ncbi:cell division protein FtsQ/DivIB [Dyadobacter sandarakinus]|uniref:Cell division protein FtsQ n=1 Tax=Dyadobacter sandarakinus TaxID=2747268 RepID=A0ABX7IC70_9BACT|nr:cell division protein FtsQ/DivIB [Dyadobacter sandarakinus]QRR03127.1 hypothetical protein HWI92_20520 [Dyadobacter sandarakinus]
MLRKFDYPWLLLKRSLWLILPIAGIGMAENKLGSQRCNNLVISIQGDSGTRFLNQMDVRMLVTENGGDPLMGSRLNDVELHELERRVRRSKLIKKCQIFRDLRGDVVIEVEQEKPLARWINSSVNGEVRNTSGYYISDEGVFFPLSDSYSARTLLVSGPYFNNPENLKSGEGASLMELLKYLNEDPFWRAQVSELIVDRDGEISLMTVLGDQVIEFGKADAYQAKFWKLRTFYNKVLSRDWGRYKRINVKFQDQIVCE